MSDELKDSAPEFIKELEAIDKELNELEISVEETLPTPVVMPEETPIETEQTLQTIQKKVEEASRPIPIPPKSEKIVPDGRHSMLTELDYESSGHTGFQPAGDYILKGKEEDPVFKKWLTSKYPKDMREIFVWAQSSGSSGGITQAQADARYLMLDTSNDPLTGNLDLGSNGISVGAFTMSTGAQNAYVLTSDGSGVGTWQPAGAGTVTDVIAGSGIVVSQNGTEYTINATGSGSSSLTIGDPISGGTSTRVLFENGSNDLAESDNLTFDGNVLRVGFGSGGEVRAYGTPSEELRLYIVPSTASVIRSSTLPFALWSETQGTFLNFSPTLAGILTVQTPDSGNVRFTASSTNPSPDAALSFQVGLNQVMRLDTGTVATSGYVLTALGSDGKANWSPSSTNLVIGSSVSGGGANRVLYENSSQNLAASTAMTFDGSTFRSNGISVGYSETPPTSGMIISGSLGIGSTTTTGSKLVVVQPGNAVVTTINNLSGSSTQAALMGFGRTAPEFYIGTLAAADQFLTGVLAGDTLIACTSTSNGFRISSGVTGMPELNVMNGAVGINRTAPTRPLEVTGSGHFSSDVTTGGNLMTAPVSGGGTGRWKLGRAQTTGSLSLSTTNYIEVEIDGTPVRLAVVS